MKKYVNNATLHGEIIKFHETSNISEELHMMFYEMCNRIIMRPRFLRYTKEWKEDMCHTAYLKCIKVLQKGTFSTDKTNPFSYFTTVITNCFLDCTHAENKQKIIRENLMELQDIENMIICRGE